MVHALEEICARTPADANEAALDAILPQAAWEALLRDAFQGLRPPYIPQTLRRWLQATHPQPWAIGAPQAISPPHHHHTERERARARGRQGTEGDTPAGQGRAQSDRQAPIGTGHRV